MPGQFRLRRAKNCCTLMKTTLSVNGPPSSEKKKTRSRSEPGKTASIAPGDRDGSTASLTKPQTPDSIPPLNSVILNLIQNLVFLVFDLNQERGTDPRSVTKNRLSSANEEPLNGQTVFLAPTCHNPQPPLKSRSRDDIQHMKYVEPNFGRLKFTEIRTHVENEWMIITSSFPE